MSISVAIDGPAGAGKSTIAKKIAKEKKYIYVDTGAMYRAFALYLIRNGIDADDSETIKKVCSDVNISITYKNDEQQVILNGENVNGLIRTEEVGQMSSASSVNKDLRLQLVELQRDLAKTANVIMDGRDIGTYVLPHADLKIYLTASSSERARRRWSELTGRGIECNQDEIEAEIIERDNRDKNREFAPLKQASDAIYLDSSDMNIEQVVECILREIQKIVPKD